MEFKAALSVAEKKIRNGKTTGTFTSRGNRWAYVGYMNGNDTVVGSLRILKKKP